MPPVELKIDIQREYNNYVSPYGIHTGIPVRAKRENKGKTIFLTDLANLERASLIEWCRKFDDRSAGETVPMVLRPAIGALLVALRYPSLKETE